ncbi:hypothetical protein CJF32_00008075 [Rutstroemia sp. NJR-2017a WRK4]|nr:hypothetical protein CJF32_00008075 [Rutstroemia sp. NJR-2017a WRK4]
MTHSHVPNFGRLPWTNTNLPVFFSLVQDELRGQCRRLSRGPTIGKQGPSTTSLISPWLGFGLTSRLDSVKVLSNVLRDIDDVVSQQDGTQSKGLDEVTHGCVKVLEELEETLDKYQELDSKSNSKGTVNKTRRVWKRIQFDPKDIDRHRSRITLNISALNAFLARTTGDVTLATKQGVDRLNQRQDEQLFQDIAEWLMPTNYAIQQTDLKSKVQPGTGQWLLDSQEFGEWMSEGKSTLFCPGIPGAGKTMITAILVDHLMTNFRDDHSVGVAYIYCNFRRQYEQLPIHLLLSILKQLFQSRPLIPESVKKLYERYKGDKSRPTSTEILQVLAQVSSEYSRIFILVDALDESQLNPRDRAKVLTSLFDLQAKIGANLFATSRSILDVTREFEGSSIVEISAREADVQKFVNHQMDRLPEFVLRNLNMQAEIKTTISNAVNGMFLLAHLYMDALTDKTNPKALKTALKSFMKDFNVSGDGERSKALDRAYEDAMDRINRQKEGFKNLGVQILSWITCARRPLSTLELRHALAIEIGTAEFDEEGLSETEDLVAVCAGLVTVDQESKIIRLVHHTTQEYFERTYKIWFPRAQIEIANACTTYLSLMPSKLDSEFESRLRLNPLYSYAAQYWGDHAYFNPSEAHAAVLRFLRDEPKVSSASQALMAVQSSSGYSQRVPKQVSALHLAAYFGLTEAMTALIKDGLHPDLKDKNGRTPLSWAAEEGNTEVVTLLLSKTDEVDPNSRDNRGRTPLSFAAEQGCEEVLSSLIGNQRVNPNGIDKYGRTPLSWAVERGRETIVKLLLALDAIDLNCKDKYGRTALLWAIEMGHLAVMKILIERKELIIRCEDKYGQTPLLLAGHMDSRAMIEYLLSKKPIDINHKDSHGETLLHKAVLNGNKELAARLLEMEGVDKDCADQHGYTPIMLSMAIGNKELVDIFWNCSDINKMCTNNFGDTLLYWAASCGNEKIVSDLLKSGQIDPEGRGWALIRAAIKNEVGVMNLLIDAGCDVNAAGDGNKTPLYHAARHGSEAAVKALLNIPCVNINFMCSSGDTPLSVAIYYWHANIATILLDQEHIDVVSNGHRALTFAVMVHNNILVKRLLDMMGFDPNFDKPAVTNILTKCLWDACSFGNHEGLKLLLDAGADQQWQAQHGVQHKNLDGAAKNGHEKVVELLLDSDDTTVDSCETALSAAVYHGHVAVVQLILRKRKEDLSAWEESFSLLSSLLITATNWNRANIAEILIDHGADVNFSNMKEETPLFIAATLNKPSVVKVLVESPGIDVDREDRAGRTPLSWAAEKGWAESVQILLWSDAVDPNSDFCDERTPLSWAAGEGNTAAVQVLLDCEAVDPDKKDFEGRTPLWWAEKNDHKEVVELLRSRGCVG